MSQSHTDTADFRNLNIAPKLLAILDQAGFVVPTPIQKQSIPTAIEGKDLIGVAQTGTGKTLAFGVPMIQRLATHKGMGLVVLPTRELALQVDESLRKIGRSLGLKTAVIIGGESMGRQLQAIRRQPHIIIATPGRLNDHIEQRTIKLDTVKILVLDEADRMLDMGFAPQIEKILKFVPKVRQTMLFSATMPEEIVGIAKRHMAMPVRVEVAPAGTATKQVTQELFFIHKESKLGLLQKILNEYKGTVLVFTRTKFGAKKIALQIRNFGVPSAEIHSNRSLSQRLEALNGFKNGKYRVLVATDVVARGLDVTGIELVVNYDLPESPEDYVHRIGRTGRANLTGHAISFATPDQKRDVRDIERLIRTVLPVTPAPDLPRVTSAPEAREYSREYRPRTQESSRSYKPRGSFPDRTPRKSYTKAPAKTASTYSREPQTTQFAGLAFRYGGESVADKRLRRQEPRRFKSERRHR